MKKLVLAVIDGCKPSMLERAVATGRAPALKAILDRGVYVDDSVAAFPSVTPVCAASIATGTGPDQHHIPSMNWYSREERRYIEYGSSFSASRRFGLARSLIDTVYNMNGHHLSADVSTVFEKLDDADIRTAGTTYLMYRGRHRHEVARDNILSRAAGALFKHSVLGPRELFYADIFASRKTPCRSTLGLPGARDQHSGCVAEVLVRDDLFDFLLLSLPDNDTYSHKHGPHAQVESIAAADRQMVRMMDAGGGIEAFLDEHAVIVAADHSHAGVERVTHLPEAFEDFAILRPAADNADEAEIAVCPAQRSAGLYALVPEGRNALLPRLIATARRTPGVDLTMWRTSSGEAAIASATGELRFAPGSDVVDRRGERWSVSGDLDVLGAKIEDGRLLTPAYPDALSRVWSAITAPTSGDVLLSAAPGYEFADWGGQAHVGGGSHGSLHASDSLGVLAWCGTGPATREVREEWSLRDITPMIAEHFGVA
ncbi:MAG: type phosphodiesterase/nucleotide pyrophosphatase [Solirubrobacterales bacterium]|nr:type phosphodiesterase/nucleotide pyrophosphatase [Solirubrobacterales bacterium]